MGRATSWKLCSVEVLAVSLCASPLVAIGGDRSGGAQEQLTEVTEACVPSTCWPCRGRKPCGSLKLRQAGT